MAVPTAPSSHDAATTTKLLLLFHAQDTVQNAEQQQQLGCDARPDQQQASHTVRTVQNGVLWKTSNSTVACSQIDRGCRQPHMQYRMASWRSILNQQCHARVPVSPAEQGLSPLTISPTEKKGTFESIHRAAGQPNPPKMPPALALRLLL